MIALQQFCDARLSCCDGEISTPRDVVALVYPFLFSILTELENTDSLMLILPQYQMLELEKKLMSRISCGLKVNKNSISNNIIPHDFHNNSMHT